MNITFTVDVEDPSERYAANGRYVDLTRHILDLCDAHNRRATFFAVGRVAESTPDLIREIAARGHEIAYHSRAHVALTKENPERFRAESRADKDRFEQLTGQPVMGFRAPRFSLTPRSLWALDILAELGFRYSSSVMPTDVSLFGFPDAPQSPFLWPNGMIEFPLPVFNLGKYRLPYLGGIYLYTMPSPLLRFFLRRSKPDEALWTYTHPYDFDDTEKFAPLPNTPLWVSIILWLARKNAAGKIGKVLTMGAAAPLRDRVPEKATMLKII